MGWYYRAPQAFPALYINMLREASEQPNEPIVFASFATTNEAKALAEKFRWFRWCIREIPTAHRELTLILESYDIRTSVFEDEVGYLLHVTAKPTKLNEFIRLNPELAEEVLSTVS